MGILFQCFLLALILIFQSCDAILKSISLEFQVKEHSEIGFLIADLWETYRLQDQTISTPETLTFQLMKENEFVSLESGKLFIKTDIDREQICAKPTLCCCLNVIVVVSRSKIRTAYFEIRLSIEDINDHAPSWVEPKLMLSVPEHTKIGSKYQLPPARDPDQSASYSISRYSLRFANKSQQGLFSLVYDSQWPTGPRSPPLLRVDGDIDRESIDKIELVLVAEDGGNPRLSGSTALLVSITDINDNAPYFVSPPSELRIRENNAPGHPVCRLVARDADVSDTEKLSFSLGPSLSADDAATFAVDRRSGWVTVLRPLDHETDPSVFQLPVQVTDGARIAETTLAVRVIDENDNAPRISLLPLVTSRDDTLLLEENVVGARAVATLVVEDPDSRAAVLTCSSGSPAVSVTRVLPVQPVSETSTNSLTRYSVVVTRSLDRETTPLLESIISCHDDGIPAQTARLPLRIRVIDRNDCAPRFSSPLITVTVDEGQSPGSIVTRLNATDDDAGLNAQLVYRVGHALFSVDAASGVLQTASVLDRERAAEHTVQAVVLDRGGEPGLDPAEPVLSGSTMVRVIVRDVNDCPPVFQRPSYEFSIAERSAGSSLVGRVTADDADADPAHRRITYAMRAKPDAGSGNAAALRHFSVSPDGAIYTSQIPLDRETQESHSFSIEAWDNGPATHRVSVDVLVRVDDVNDNWPQWRHSTDAGLVVNVTRHETVGKLITVLKATDADAGLNASLTYEIVQSNELDMFRISPKSGSLHLTKQPTASTPDIIRLVVKVSDGAPVPLSNTTTVRIYFLPDISKPLSDNRFFEKDLVVMICMITVTLIVSAILVVAIVLLKCRHCFRSPQAQFDTKDYRQGHPDGQSSPTTSDMFNSAIKLSPDVPLYHNQLYHSNRLVYESPSGLMSFQPIRKPDSLPLYYTLSPKRPGSDEVTDMPANYVNSRPFSNLYGFPQRHYALAQDFIPIPSLSPENVSMHYFAKQRPTTTPTSTKSTPALTPQAAMPNPEMESSRHLQGEVKIHQSVKWCDSIDDKKVYEKLCGPDNAEILCNHSLMTKDQISSFV